jgi:hypothetical protein
MGLDERKHAEILSMDTKEISVDGSELHYHSIWALVVYQKGF